MPLAKIESLDHEGQGVARVEGKVVFIEGALPGESVSYSSFRKKSRFEVATTTRVIEPSFARVSPRCRYFGVCGGCSLQHLEPSVQVAVKQRVLEDALIHIGNIRPDVILPAVQGPQWGYRHRARFAVRFVQNKGGALVGFHEKRSSFITDMQSCEVLPPRISRLLAPLRDLVTQLSIAKRLPQIEIAAGEGGIALVLRNLAPLNDKDMNLVRDFAEKHGVDIYLQPGGPESARRFCPEDGEPLYYALPEFGVRIYFAPTDFIQVNTAMNRALVRRAISLLQPKPGERIADLFCGLGNFALPIARSGAEVVGIEGSSELVARAQENAKLNELAQSISFVTGDLLTTTFLRELGPFDKLLIDPPRDGAIEVVKALTSPLPSRIVYVSCNPATLARDASVLVHTKGYRLQAAGVMNMFPHTAHVESIALFEC
jgi:23S rRNA (uracil1939-C5)-methyltransferase